MKGIRHGAAIVLATIVGTVSTAEAARVDLVMDWQGLGGYQGSATASFSFDTALLPSFQHPDPRNNRVVELNDNPLVYDFALTLNNTDGYDGTWGLEYFEYFSVQTFLPLDYSRELIGQTTNHAAGCTFGSDAPSCFGIEAGRWDFIPFDEDFIIGAGESSATNLHWSWFRTYAVGVPPSNFELDLITLTSVRPVPLPAAAPLLAGSVVLLGLIGRRARAPRA